MAAEEWRKTGTDEWSGERPLHEMLQIPEKVRCICAAGAGGKTGLLYQLADSYRTASKKTLLITTTKMYRPEKCGMMDCTADEIADYLEKTGFVIAGTALPDEKMGPLPPDILKQVMKKADITLAEADGSRRLPLKVPGKGEPVILPECDFLIVVEGMSAVGKTLGQVCHRLENAAGILGLPLSEAAEKQVTVHTAACLAKEGYAKYLKMREGFFFMNQTDCLTAEQERQLEQEMQGEKTVLGSLQTGNFRILRRQRVL